MVGRDDWEWPEGMSPYEGYRALYDLWRPSKEKPGPNDTKIIEGLGVLYLKCKTYGLLGFKNNLTLISP